MKALALVIALLGACSSGEDDGCAERWRVWVDEVAGATASVEEGSLVMRAATFGTGSTLMLGQAGVTGDFDIEVDFSDAILAGNTSYFWAYLRDPASDALVFASVMIGSDGFPTLAVGTEAGSENFNNQLTGTGSLTGRLHLRRVGLAVDLDVVDSSAEEARATGIGFASDPVELRLAVGSVIDPMATEAVAVRVDEVRVTSAAGDMSDAFDCDSLATPEPL